MNDQATITLDYAPHVPWRRRQRIRRIIGLLLLVTIVWPIWRFGPSEWKQIQKYRLQRACMNYTAPADRVVYEEDPHAAKVLLTRDSYFLGSFHLAPKVPVAMYVPSCLIPMNKQSDYTTDTGSAVLFLHERTSPAGKRRLVEIRCDPSWEPADSMPGYFEVNLDRPIPLWAWGSAEPLSLDELENVRLMHRTSSLPAELKRIRFFAGQADAVDHSHFTIGYELKNNSGEGKGIIDGWLQDTPINQGSSATIEFKIRDGPAAR